MPEILVIVSRKLHWNLSSTYLFEVDGEQTAIESRFDRYSFAFEGSQYSLDCSYNDATIRNSADEVGAISRSEWGSSFEVRFDGNLLSCNLKDHPLVLRRGSQTVATLTRDRSLTWSARIEGESALVPAVVAFLLVLMQPS